MKLLIEKYGTLFEDCSKMIMLEPSQQADFEFIDDKVVVKIDAVFEDHLVISTNRPFSVIKDGKCNLLSSFSTFEIPYAGETIIAMPLFDISFNLKFSIVKEVVV